MKVSTDLNDLNDQDRIPRRSLPRDKTSPKSRRKATASAFRKDRRSLALLDFRAGAELVEQCADWNGGPLAPLDPAQVHAASDQAQDVAASANAASSNSGPMRPVPKSRAAPFPDPSYISPPMRPVPKSSPGGDIEEVFPEVGIPGTPA